jgi:hypothetical protein
VPIGGSAAVLLIFAVGESVGGDLSGLSHLVPVVLIGLLMWLGWKHSLLAGILLLFVAAFNALRASFLIMVAPFALSGALFLVVSWRKRKPA